MHQLASEKYVAEMEKADNSAAKQKVYVKEGREVGSFQLQTTSWLALALAAHFVGLLAAGAKFWLDTRGTKPPPRVTVSWWMSDESRDRLLTHYPSLVTHHFFFHPAASSPSSRSVRHLALPPALRNSSSSTSIGS